MRNRARAAVPASRLASALLVLALCVGAALVGSSWLLGHADAASGQGPVAAYSFDEGEGSTVEDLTGNGHTGTIEGAKWTTHGRYGGALEFDAAEEACVTVANSSELQLTEEFTLEAWVRPSAETEDDPVIFKETEHSLSYALFLTEGGYPEGVVGTSSPGLVTNKGSSPLPQNAWTHIAATYDGAHLRLYVDGELVKSVSSGSPVASEKPLRIGCNEVWGEGFTGRIDEVQIYDRALSEGEVQADKAAPIKTPQRSPVAAYSFDAGEGETAEDITGNGHDGTIEGPTWTTRGKYGDALSFNGEGEDCVTVPESEELQLSEELTLEAWVKPSGPTEDDPIIFKESLGIGGVPSYAMGIGVTNEGKPEGIIGDEAISEEVEGPKAIESNVWTHLAFTYDGAHMRLYVNGTLVATEKEERSPPEAPGHLRIGCSAPWYEEGFDGKIDEVRIYSRALSEGEIQADMSTALPNPPTAVTGSAEVLGPSEAIFTGTVDPNSTETTYRFEYGTTTAYGEIAPEIEEEVLYANESQAAEEAVAYLQPNTTYHYRLVATNQAGTAVGADETLTTPPSELSPEQEAEEREQEQDYTASISTVPPDFVNLNFRGLQEHTNAQMAEVAETGASIYRISIQDLRNFRTERAKYDEVFLNAAANHMKVLFVLGSRHLTTNKSALAKRVEEIVLRYGKANAGGEGSIWGKKAPYAPTYWEVWNEPNIGLNSLSPPPPPSEQIASRKPSLRPGNINPQQFGAYLEVISKAIENVEKNATVIVGGLAWVGTKERVPREESEGKADEINPVKFLKEMGHEGAYDAVGFHPYVFQIGKGANKHAPENDVQVNQVRKKVRSAIRTLRVALNHVKGGTSKELWITEIGWPVQVPKEIDDPIHPSVTEAIQGKLVQSVFSTIKSVANKWKIANVFYFNYRDHEEPVEWDLHTGLLNLAGEPRTPAFEIFQHQTK